MKIFDKLSDIGYEVIDFIGDFLMYIGSIVSDLWEAIFGEITYLVERVFYALLCLAVASVFWHFCIKITMSPAEVGFEEVWRYVCMGLTMCIAVLATATDVQLWWLVVSEYTKRFALTQWDAEKLYGKMVMDEYAKEMEEI